MKPAGSSDLSRKKTAMYGGSLAVALLLLLLGVLRAAGIYPGDPVPWYQWAILAGWIVFDLWKLLGKRSLLERKNLPYLVLLLHGVIVFIYLLSDGLPEWGSPKCNLIIMLVVGVPLLAAALKAADKEAEETEALRRRRREEELAELRRSIAPTKKPQDASPGPEETQRDEE